MSTQAELVSSWTRSVITFSCCSEGQRTAPQMTATAGDRHASLERILVVLDFAMSLQQATRSISAAREQLPGVKKTVHCCPPCCINDALLMAARKQPGAQQYLKEQLFERGALLRWLQGIDLLEPYAARNLLLLAIDTLADSADTARASLEEMIAGVRMSTEVRSTATGLKARVAALCQAGTGSALNRLSRLGFCTWNTRPASGLVLLPSGRGAAFNCTAMRSYLP
jgi:hypothetical protein